MAAIFTIMATNRRRRQHPVISHSDTLKNADEYILSISAPCRDIIIRSLDCLAQNDAIEACKNNRTGSDLLYSLNRAIDSFFPKNDLRGTYLTYMIESADKISETSRHLATKPEQKITISDKCEVRAIMKYLDEMLTTTPTGSSDTLKIAASNKNFLEHLIAERSKIMRHEDFNDGSQSYSYLILLYYLHSFTNSFYQIISISSRLPRQ